MSGNIEYFVVGTTTAVPGYYLCFHAHKKLTHAEWTDQDTKNYFRLAEDPRRLVVVENFEVSDNLASSRLEPVILRIWVNRAIRKLTIVTPQESPEVISYPAADKIARAIVAKGVEQLHISEHTKNHLPDSCDLENLLSRTDPELIRKLAWTSNPVVSEGDWKVVHFPAEAKVRLSRNHHGEFIREIPRTWA